MGTVSTGIGLFSGINTADLVNALVSNSSQTIQRLEARAQTFSVKGQGLDLLEATITTLSASVQQLNLEETYGSFAVTNFGSANYSVATNDNAVEATYNFQSLRTAATHEVLSKGFANADQQTIGAGTLTVAQGGSLNRETLLDAFNGGNGVQRGVIRITDRSGTAADIDLSNIYTVDDVLLAINNNNALDVNATTVGGQLVLTDTSGSTANDLSVIDLNNTHTAADLGIAGSTNSNSLTGTEVYEITSDFTLNFLNDGNGLHLQSGADDIRILLADGSEFDVDLDEASTIGDIVSLINNHDDNSGLVTASFADGRFSLIDQTTGANTFEVQDINSSSVIHQLKLDETAVGDTISGRRVGAGINSVLLENLRGGTGIETQGEISLTDRTGTSATIDLSNAESLDEILYAINTATSGGGTALQLQARLDETGTGITVQDISGSTTNNLMIADVGAGTIAADLGIEIDQATNQVDSGSLNVRYVNAATSLSDYAPDGGEVDYGSFLITDSAGNEAIVNLSDSVQTVGDVLLRINSAVGIQVTAELNETGDGFVLIDEAGGAGLLSVAESGGTTAADLRILGDGAIASDGKYHIESRKVLQVEVEATDTLEEIAEKINNIGGMVTANIFDDGSAFNSTRLSLVSQTSGKAGRLLIDDGGLNLGLNTVTTGNDALLRVGEDVSSGFIVSSATNQFNNVATGVDLNLLSAGTEISQVNVERDSSNIKQLLSGFVNNYNAYQSSVSSLTQFNAETSERGILQGEGVVQRIQIRLDSLINRTYLDSSNGVQSLVDLGIRTGAEGKLSFDESRLDDLLNSDPEAVKKFFLDDTNGFGQRAEQTLDSLTDPFTGTFKTEEDALQSTIADLNERVADLNEILEVKKSRLFIQFAAMEEALSQLQSQQSALTSLSNISFLSPSSGSSS